MSELDLKRELGRTIIGRQAIEYYSTMKLQDALQLARALSPQVILVDRDLKNARGIIETLRQDPATRSKSIAVIARGDMQPDELEIMQAGANAILRLPPDAHWDDRLAKLFAVPARTEARLAVRIEAETVPDTHAVLANISAGGMLVETTEELPVHTEFNFRFKLPDGSTVTGRARVRRRAGPMGFGVEFMQMDDESRKSIRQFIRSWKQA